MSELRYPLYIFPAFTLNPSKKQNVAYGDEELLTMIKEAISASPIGEVLISTSPEPFHDEGEGSLEKLPGKV